MVYRLLLFAVLFSSVAGVLEAQPKGDRDGQPIESQLAIWWKEFNGGSRKWVLFDDAEVFPQGGGRGRMSPLAQAIRIWQSDGEWGRGWGRGRGPDRGAGEPGAKDPRGEGGNPGNPEMGGGDGPRPGSPIEERMERIRTAASETPDYLQERIEPYVRTLELFHAATKSGSVEAIGVLLDTASLEDRLSPQAMRRLLDLRPELVQREAMRALRRIEGRALADLLVSLLEAEVKSGDRQRVGFELLAGLVGDEVTDKERLDRIGALCIASLTTSKLDRGRIAAAVTLRALSEKVEAFRLAENAREGLLQYLEKSIGRAPEDLALIVLQVLAGHPHFDSLERLVALMARSRSYSDNVSFELWRTLSAISPASIARQDGAEAWTAWWAKEREEPRLRQWIADHARSAARPQADSDYAQARFYGVPVVGRSVTFVVDVSYSMDQPMQGTDQRTKIDGAKAELERAIQALADEVQFTLVTFDGDAHVWSRKRVTAASARNRALDYVRKLTTGPSTNIHAALLAAFGLTSFDLRSSVTGIDRPDQLILLSDGNPSAGELRNSDDLLTMVDRLDPGALTRIDTIAFGRDADTEFLKELATRHRGEMVEIR